MEVIQIIHFLCVNTSFSVRLLADGSYTLRLAVCQCVFGITCQCFLPDSSILHHADSSSVILGIIYLVTIVWFQGQYLKMALQL